VVLLRRGFDHDLDYGAENPVRQKIWALVVAALAGVALAAVWAGNSGFTDYSPGVLTVQGASICSGSPTSGDPLVYNGTDWCGGVPNNTGLQFIEASGTHFSAATLDTNGDLIFQAPGQRVYIQNGQLFVPGNGGIAWDDLTDLIQGHESRTPLTLYDALTSGTYTTAPGQYTPSVNMHIRSLEVTLRSPLTSCTTYPTYEITLVGSAQATDAVTLTANYSHWITNSGALAVPAGDAVSIVAETAGVSCSPSANNATFVMEMTTD
jgi:hypothetical protein